MVVPPTRVQLLVAPCCCRAKPCSCSTTGTHHLGICQSPVNCHYLRDDVFVPPCNAFWCRKLFLLLYFSLVFWRTHSENTGIDISACYLFIDTGEKKTPSALSYFALYRNKTPPPLQMWFWSAKSLPAHGPESSSRLWAAVSGVSPFPFAAPWNWSDACQVHCCLASSDQ